MSESTTEVTPVRRGLGVLADGLDRLLAALDDGGLDHETDAELVAVLQGFERVRNRMALVDHRLVQAVQARGLAEALCQGTVRRVLTSTLRISAAEAGRRVRAADAVGPRTSTLGEVLDPVRPALAAAQARGDVTPEQVGIVAAALAGVDRRGFDPADITAGEHLLTTHALAFGPEDLRELAGRVVDAIDPDGTLPNDEVNHDRRMLAIRPTADGAYVGEFRLTGVAGAKLTSLLEPLAKPRLAQTALISPSEGAGGVPPRLQADTDPRTYPQRMHDALEELCDRLLAVGDKPGTGGVPATVVVTISLDDLLDELGYGRTADGTLLSAAEVLRLAGQAEIVPAVLDASGAVLDLGRTQRLANRAQALALDARDGGCSFPGCDRAPQWTERHHIVAWMDGGPTDLDNLTLLCRYHHHHFGQRGWTCRLNVDRLPEWTPPRWIDPDQKPLLNTRITTRLTARRHTRRRDRGSLLERLWERMVVDDHTFPPLTVVDRPPFVDLARS